MNNTNLNDTQNNSQMNNQMQIGEKSRFDKGKNEAKNKLLRQIDEAKKELIKGNSAIAGEIAFKALVEQKEALGGESSIHLLPGYFILAEANIQEGKLKKAEEFLIAAYWNFLKQNKSDDKKNEDDSQNKFNQKNDISQDEINEYRGTLHKTFSKLFLAQQDYTKALDELKNGIYMDSIKYGPEHEITAQNYYQMGNIFLAKKQYAEAEAMFGQYAKIWYNILKKLFRETDDPSSQIFENNLLYQEALSCLKEIERYLYQKQDNYYNAMIDSYKIRTNFALALINKLIQQEDIFIDYMKQVSQLTANLYGQDHKKTQKVLEVLEMAENVREEDEDQHTNQEDQYTMQDKFDQSL